MSIEKVKSLMKDVGWGVLATTDGKTVGVRPMGGWAWMQDELWCATFTISDKVGQLKKIPNAEYCFGRPDGEHVRISGSCTISTDNADKFKLHDAVPILKKYIPDPAAPEYVVIRMKPDRIRHMETDSLSYKEVLPV